MATKVHMEALSPTMEEGQIVSWLKGEGDPVDEGDVIAEIETDKATMELVARGSGVLRKQILGEGATAPVGSVIGVIAAEDEDVSSILEEAGAPSGDGAAAEAPAEEGEPAEAAGTDADADTATDTDAEQTEEEEAEEETEKGAAAGASQEEMERSSQGADEGGGKETAEEAGAASEAVAKTTTAPADARQAAAAGKPGAGRRAQPAAPAEAAGDGRGDGARVKASPLARRLAEEAGVDLSGIQGSGPGGRIVKRDVEQAGTGAPAAPAAAGKGARPAAAGAPLPAPADVPEVEDVPVSQMRKTIAKRLVESIGPVPTFYLTTEADMGRMMELRGSINERLEEQGVKVSVNDLIIKATAAALRRHPDVNAAWHGDVIRRHGRVHIGVAVAVDEGLITPVIRDADRKGAAEIAVEVRELAGRAREKKLKPEEYTGATFSVSNLGMFGIDEFTAIINPPEAGILAVGRVEEKPVVENGRVVPRQRMRMTMSCDHRVVDGATGARFLQTLKAFLEEPMMMVV